MTPEEDPNRQLLKPGGKVSFPVEIDEDGYITIVDDRRNPWRLPLVIMTAALFAFSGLGWLVVNDAVDNVHDQQARLAEQQARLDQFANTLRRASVAGCERQNLVREGMRDLAQLANQGLRSVTPNVPPNAASRAVIHRRQDLRRDLATAPCQRVYPPRPGGGPE